MYKYICVDRGADLFQSQSTDLEAGEPTLKQVNWLKVGQHGSGHYIHKYEYCILFIDDSRVYVFAGLDHWTGLLGWTTGLTFDLILGVLC